MNHIIRNVRSILPMRTALDKLARMRLYSDGWAFGEGKAFPARVCERAEKLLIAMSGFPGNLNADVFPGRNASITVTIYRGADSFNFVVSNDRIDVVVEDGEGEERHVAFADAVSELSKQLPLTAPVLETRIASAKWNSFESFIPIITSQPKIGFVVKPSSPTSKWAILASLKRNAPSALPGMLVAT